MPRTIQCFEFKVTTMLKRRKALLSSGFLTLAASWLLAAPASAAPPLPALNVDITQTSVSGLSSGGFMAVQFQLAYSEIIVGAGIVAGGPYACAQGSVLTAVSKCSCTGEPAIACQVSENSAAVPALVDLAKQSAQQGTIDSLANIPKQRVITINGTKDTRVPPPVASQLAVFYATLGVSPDKLSTLSLDQAGHTFPTPAFGNDCGDQENPYMGRCGVDSAEKILSWIYGPLQPPTPGASSGKFIEFDQKSLTPRGGFWNFLFGSGLDDSGWAYVPESCARGKVCRAHIALHGCKQGQSHQPLHPIAGQRLYYGSTFIKNSGYDRWADNNHLVILFPQAKSIPWRNPNGCWDWWGYTGSDYATKNGLQIRALKAMVDRIGAGRPSTPKH